MIRFQFRLLHLFSAVGICALAAFLLVHVLLPVAMNGSLSDLSPAEKKSIASLQNSGLFIREGFT